MSELEQELCELKTQHKNLLRQADSKDVELCSCREMLEKSQSECTDIKDEYQKLRTLYESTTNE